MAFAFFQRSSRGQPGHQVRTGLLEHQLFVCVVCCARSSFRLSLSLSCEPPPSYVHSSSVGGDSLPSLD